jgi:hypothetical protein
MVRRLGASFLLATVVTLGSACGPGTAPVGQPAMATLTKGNLESFREAFNQASGQTRIILLLSPT